MMRTSGGAHLRTPLPDRKSTRLNSSHGYISYAVFCLKKKATVYERPLLPGKQAEKDARDKCAAIRGFKEAVYLADIPVFFLAPGGQQYLPLFPSAALRS